MPGYRSIVASRAAAGEGTRRPAPKGHAALTPLTRSYCKLCELEDFADPRVRAAMASILPERDPLTHMERKVWEFALCALFLEDVGALHEDARVLAVGAGDERLVFWLANHVGEVVATDIYGDGEFAEAEAGASMLTAPASHAPFPYREERLTVRWMDMRRLAFDDGAFDAVISLSSIEHLHAPRDRRAAAREIGRVVRRGGHAFIATDLLVRHHLLDTAPVDLAKRLGTLGRRCCEATPWRRAGLEQPFTAREVMRRVVGASGLELMQPLDRSLSRASWRNVATMDDDGVPLPGEGSFWPHIVLRHRRSCFTSVGLPLRRP